MKKFITKNFYRKLLILSSQTSIIKKIHLKRRFMPLPQLSKGTGGGGALGFRTEGDLGGSGGGSAGGFRAKKYE